MRFLEIVANRRISVDYGTPEADDPHRFRMKITIDEQADGKCVLTLRQLQPSRDRRDEVIGFGAVKYGPQTFDKLAGWLTAAKFEDC